MLRLRRLIWKEFLELRQDPRLFGLVIVAPIIQLTLLGYAATTDVKEVPIVVADGDRSPASRDLIARFQASSNFKVVNLVTTTSQIDRDLQEDRAWMALAIPNGYGASVRSGEPVTVQVVADGSNSNSTTVALGYTNQLVAEYAANLAGAAGVNAPAIDLRIRVWFNSDLESRYFMIPGVLALLLLLITANLAAMGIVREKELGTLEQLNVTPLRRRELIVGKLLPYGFIGLIDVLLVTAVAVFWFEVPLRGSFGLLLGLSLLYLTCTLGLGLLISTMSNTQQQAMMTATFFFLTPMIYLSGFIFPIENMPQVIQYLTYIVPLRYFLVIVRGIFLKGIGLSLLWPQVAALAAWGAVVLSLAVMRSRKRIG
jgi:ABC-2 type transport system permease protein